MRRVLACAALLCVLPRAFASEPTPPPDDALGTGLHAPTARNADAAAQEMYRSAEFALHRGDSADTRRVLRALIERYPSSPWAARGQRLLDAVPGDERSGPSEAADAPFVPALPSTTPEEALSRLRAAVGAGADDQALGEAYDFIKRYPNRADRYEVGLAAAALHLRRGEPERALKFLLPLTRTPSRDPALRPRALHLLGGALTALGRDADVLKAVPAADPASTPDRWLALAQIWRASALDKMGRKDEAGELYRALAASGHQSPVRAYALAAIASDWDRQGKPDRARDALSRAAAEAARWRLDGLRDALTLASANELLRARRLADAAQAYGDFTEAFPTSPLLAQAYYERGLALKRLGKAQEAVAAFESLLERAPQSAYAADAHLQLGQLDTELGRTDSALTHYRTMGKTSEAKDADREALLLMAQVHYNAKRWRDAIPLYRRYLQNAPEDAKTKEVQGLLLASLWQADRDDPDLADLAAKLPDHPLVAPIRWQLAAAAYKRRDFVAAEELLRRQIEAEPHSPRAAEARFYRAESLRELGKTADAIDAYRRLLSAHPQDKRARAAAMRLGALLYENGDAAGAADAYGRVTGTDADAADAAYDRALALTKAGKIEAADWENFAERFPKHAKAPGAWWAAARLHEKLKRTAAAKAAYGRLKAASPKNDPSRLAGLLRLALLLELEDKPREAAPLYTEVMELSERASPGFETARKRLEALTHDKALLEK